MAKPHAPKVWLDTLCMQDDYCNVRSSLGYLQCMGEQDCLHNASCLFNEEKYVKPSSQQIKSILQAICPLFSLFY